MNRFPLSPWLLLPLLAATSAFAFPTSGTLYTPPTSEPFVENAGETVVTVNDSSGSIATAQSALSAAYANHPGAIIVLNLSGTYTVTTSPLVLSSHTCVVLQANTVIQAGAGATASALIQVSGQTNVSIAGGTLLGNGVGLNAIQALTSNRVEIDQVTVQNCGADGIVLTGNGNTAFDNELAVTRCAVTGCAGNGISLTNGTQGVVIDNACSNNSLSGIYLALARSTAANNTCNGNGTGITAVGTYTKVSDNTTDGNGTGIVLAAGGSHNVAASNHVDNNTTLGLSDAGTSDVVFQNVFSGNASDLSATGTGANIVAWQSPLAASGQNYFYPPLIDNQHTATTIVNGKGRYDLTIGNDTLDDVQTQYNNAVSANPNAVVVLHLTGTYSVGANALNLGSNTVVLLSGTIQESSATTATNVITLTSGATNVAISGGTIDGGGRTVVNGVNLSGGNCVWIHATTVQNFGVPSTRTGDSNGLIKFSGMKGPAFVSSCTTTESGTRGIWTEGFGPYVITDNQSHQNNMDGVDCDYTTQEALVKDNDCSTNTRYGVFIEQGATYNVAYHNTCSSGLSRGINLYNNGEPSSLPVAYNTVFCNVCNGDSNALRNGSGGTGSDGTTPLTSHNFLFNNTATNSTNDGIQSGVTGTQNYYSQTILANNGTNISTSGSETFFDPPAPPAGTTYTVTASAGTGGTISPSGTVTVNQGASQTFAITASSGYAISDVTVDGISVGAVSSYTFSNVQANHTISAAFAALPTYTIAASAGTGGTISPSGNVTVNQGASQTFTIAASAGYSISSVTVDGTSVGAVSSYTFSNVQANHTISAAFAAAPPAAPTNLAAKALRTAGQIKLTWTQSTSANITGNKVYRSTTSGGLYALVATLGVTTSYTDTGLTSRTTYYYVVTAVNSGGAESAYSNQSSATAK